MGNKLCGKNPAHDIRAESRARSASGAARGSFFSGSSATTDLVRARGGGASEMAGDNVIRSTSMSPRVQVQGPMPETTAPKKQKLDPADFMFIRQEHKTLVRAPGDIAGQQFIIEYCKDCDIYLLDTSACVTIDDCEDCRIFIGPCEGSVFVRTSKRCKIIAACQQFRTRQVTKLDVLLFVGASQPVIEDSTKVRFGCFDFEPYPALAAQFQAAHLNPWNSEWSNVHDFHANGGSSTWHWQFLEPNQATAHALGFKPIQDVCPAAIETKEPGPRVTPRTYGRGRELPSMPGTGEQETAVAVVVATDDAPAHALLAALADALAKTLFLIRCRSLTTVKTAQLQAALAQTTDAATAQRLANAAADPTSQLIAMEFQGRKARTLVRTVAAPLQEHILAPTRGIPSLVEYLFERV